MGTQNNERWLSALDTLGEQRHTPAPVRERAAALCRQLGVTPWVALAVAEGTVSLGDAATLDRAAKCKELQAAVLDRRLPLAELRRLTPYAFYFLAVELTATRIEGLSRLSDALAIARSLLTLELTGPVTLTDQTVRRHPFEVYRAAAMRVMNLIHRYRLPLPDAIDVETGSMPLAVAQRRLAIKISDAQWRASHLPPSGNDRRPAAPAGNQNLDRDRNDQSQGAHKVE